MAMEMNRQHRPLTTYIDEGARKAAVRRAMSPINTRGRGTTLSDSINPTHTVRMLKKMEASLSTVSVVDVKRVESIKQSIMNGSFNIDPDRVAEKMLNYESMLKRT